mgnify:CR=1 FL=1
MKKHMIEPEHSTDTKKKVGKGKTGMPRTIEKLRSEIDNLKEELAQQKLATQMAISLPNESVTQHFMMLAEQSFSLAIGTLVSRTWKFILVGALIAGIGWALPSAVLILQILGDLK